MWLKTPTLSLCRSRLTLAGLVLFVAGAAVAPDAARAQGGCESMTECQAHRPALGFEQELRTAGVNALLGGATAAVVRMVRGEPVWDGFLAGAVGGGVGYVGKRIAVEDFYGAGFLGRELASVGGSVVRNAAAGVGPLDEVVLPVGPVRLYVSRERGIVPRVDMASVVAAGAFMLAYDARFDPAASLSAGALVFRGNGLMPGLSSAGAMMVWDDARIPADEGPRLMAHERVHILQYDQAFLAWGEPMERWVTDRSRLLPRNLLDHVDIGGLVVGARGGLSLAMDYHDRPWEHEAYFLAETAHPVR